MSISLFSGARKHCHFSALKFRFVFVIAFAFWFLTERKIYALKFTRNKRQSIFEASRLRHTHACIQSPGEEYKERKIVFLLAWYIFAAPSMHIAVKFNRITSYYYTEEKKSSFCRYFVLNDIGIYWRFSLACETHQRIPNYEGINTISVKTVLLRLIIHDLFKV